MTNPAPLSDLSFSPEQMRDIGHAFVDLIVEQFERVGDLPALRKNSRDEMERLFREDPPDKPRDVYEVLKRLRNEVFENYAPLNHPRFFGFVPSPVNFISVMAESLAAAHNPFMGSWLVSPGPTQIELVTIDWLSKLCGLPESSGGLFVSGGSMANLSAIASARKNKLDDDMAGGTAYCSEQTHSSIDRAMQVLGFTPDQLRHIDSDDALRLDPRKLANAIEEDSARGLRPFMVIATAGTTNTGAIDPLSAIADICEKQNLWLHVDGAYGAPALLTDSGKALLTGIERADSITLDPHKWLFQPYEIGCILTRERKHLIDTFHVYKDYLRDAIGEAEEINLRDYGVQLTRNFRALKLWMSIQVFGLDAFRAAVSHGIHLAEYAERLLRERDHWEVVTPASIGIVSFRYLPPTPASPAPPVGDDEKAVDEINLKLIDAMQADGYAMVSSTTIHGRSVMRLCPINPRTTEDDIRGTFDKFEVIAQKIS